MTKTPQPIVDPHTESKKTCFVITPIGPEGSEIRRMADGVIEAVLKPVLEGMGFKVEAAHHIATPGSITQQVVQRVIDAELVIANLTTLNANVLYELAIRHCSNKPVISIVEQGTSLPFDVSDERTLFYDNDMAGVEVLKKKLAETVRATLQEKTHDNPVTRAERASDFSKTVHTADPNAVLFNEVLNIGRMVQRLANQVQAIDQRTGSLAAPPQIFSPSVSLSPSHVGLIRATENTGLLGSLER